MKCFFSSQETIIACLQCRYAERVVYTYVGNILVAVNPFEQLSIYEDEVKKVWADVVYSNMWVFAQCIAHFTHCVVCWADTQPTWVQSSGGDSEINFLSRYSPGALKGPQYGLGGASGCGMSRCIMVILSLSRYQKYVGVCRNIIQHKWYTTG